MLPPQYEKTIETQEETFEEINLKIELIQTQPKRCVFFVIFYPNIFKKSKFAHFLIKYHERSAQRPSQ